MALTRAEIRSNVESFTGKSNKTTLINSFCDLGLKQAQLRHKFSDGKKTYKLPALTGETFIDLPRSCKNIIALAVLDSSNNARKLTLKSETWYNVNISSPEECSSGWPDKCCRFGKELHFDRPLDADYTIKMRCSTYPVFEDDTTECPIDVLDVFLTYYVTALVFQSVEDNDNYVTWMRRAVGVNFDAWNGGEFSAAVSADEGDNALEHTAADIVKNEAVKPSLFTDDGTAWFRG